MRFLAETRVWPTEWRPIKISCMGAEICLQLLLPQKLISLSLVGWRGLCSKIGFSSAWVTYLCKCPGNHSLYFISAQYKMCSLRWSTRDLSAIIDFISYKKRVIAENLKQITRLWMVAVKSPGEDRMKMCLLRVETRVNDNRQWWTTVLVKNLLVWNSSQNNFYVQETANAHSSQIQNSVWLHGPAQCC